MPDAFVFGPFRLLVGRRELLAHGVPVTLGQRAFEILLLLVSRPGQLVTKDELMAEIWPGVVVEENNIQVHVSALRKVLGTAGGRRALSAYRRRAGLSLRRRRATRKRRARSRIQPPTGDGDVHGSCRQQQPSATSDRLDRARS